MDVLVSEISSALSLQVESYMLDMKLAPYDVCNYYLAIFSFIVRVRC